MKKLILILTIALTVTVNAQTAKKKYYPYSNQIEEEYFVNGSGEKTGKYKSYYQNGLIGIETNYKNGILEGLYKEYYGYDRSCFKRTTYFINGEVNGLTAFYDGDCNVITSQGKCSANFTKIGSWVEHFDFVFCILYPCANFTKIGSWVEYTKNEVEMPQGYQYLMQTKIYENGTLVDMSKTIYYYPSKKICIERKGDTQYTYSYQGKVIDKSVYDSLDNLITQNAFYNDGKKYIELNTRIEANNKIRENTTWYNNGKLYEKSTRINGEMIAFESYEQDGSKTSNMLYYEKQFAEKEKNKEKTLKQKKEEVIEFNNNITDADQEYNQNAEVALSNYKSILNSAQIKSEHLNRINFGVDSINKAFFNDKIIYLTEKVNESEKKTVEQKIISADQFQNVSAEKTLSKYNEAIALSKEFLKGRVLREDTTNQNFLKSKISFLEPKITEYETKVNVEKEKIKKYLELTYNQSQSVSNKLITFNNMRKFNGANPTVLNALNQMASINIASKPNPNTELFFIKGSEHINSLINEFDFKRKDERNYSNLEQASILGERIITGLNKLIALSQKEQKSAGKSLKKATTKEQEITILGL